MNNEEPKEMLGVAEERIEDAAKRLLDKLGAKQRKRITRIGERVPVADNDNRNPFGPPRKGWEF